MASRTPASIPTAATGERMPLEPDDYDERIARLERRLEWLEETTVDDIDSPEGANEDVVSGGLKLRRRAVREELEALRAEREETTNDAEVES
jgi:hypothetical protein